MMSLIVGRSSPGCEGGRCGANAAISRHSSTTARGHRTVLRTLSSTTMPGHYRLGPVRWDCVARPRRVVRAFGVRPGAPEVTASVAG